MRRLLLPIILLGALAPATGAHAEFRTAKYLVTISSQPSETFASADGRYTGTAQADWTGRWFVTMHSDRAKKLLFFSSIARAATKPSTKRGTFVGTATGSFREQLSSDVSRDCSWDTSAVAALDDVQLFGSGLDGFSGGTNRSYRKSRAIGMWLEAEGLTESAFGTCTSPSGSATPQWTSSETAFLNADQCAFGAGDDIYGTDSPKAFRMGFGAKAIGATRIKSKAAGYPANAPAIRGFCNPFGQDWAAGQTDGSGAVLTSSYHVVMQRLDTPSKG